MRVTFFLNEAVRNIALTLHWSPKSPARAGPGPRAPRPRREVLASRGVVVVESWQGQAAGAISVVGKAVLTLYSPLKPLSHNVNPRDGAQDMFNWAAKPIGLSSIVRLVKASESSVRESTVQ
jgi:hypothetical protein